MGREVDPNARGLSYSVKYVRTRMAACEYPRAVYLSLSLLPCDASLTLAGVPLEIFKY